ncbi:MAG: hypothetical protein ACLP0J_23660 [Solirubrobacteraceae bacterium]
MTDQESAAAAPVVLDSARTAAELRKRIATLARELKQWRGATVDAGPLIRHQTQVLAVTRTLEHAANELGQDLPGPEGGDWIFERARSLDRKILDLYRLWGFFRDKLALRFVPWLQDAMDAADDLAWACYEPAQKHIPHDRRREPPLVYFTGGTRPTLMPRGAQYVVEPLPDGGMRPPAFAEAVRVVPVAMIGLPWYQLTHLPDAPLIVHEVGHAVDHDLALGPRVSQLIASAVPDRRNAAWQEWAAEVFADVYGVLGCGAGFAAALAGLLAGARRDVEGDVRAEGNWGAYPPRTVRVLLVEEVLRQLELPKVGLGPAWRQTYPRRHCTEFEDDVPSVVAALLEGPYDALKGRGLTTVLSFSPTDGARAQFLAERLRNGNGPDRGGIREVLAAARLAYDRDPDRYTSDDPTPTILEWIQGLEIRGPREARGSAEDEASPDEEARARRDKEAGRALWEQLVAADESDEPEG